MTERMWNHALTIAESAHQGQFRRGEEPYITHPLTVARIIKLGGYSVNTQIAGLLHDVVEDSDEWSIDDLRREGFDEEGIVDPVDRLTHKVDEATYEQYGDLIVSSLGASIVKAADMTHNLQSQPKPHKVAQYNWLLGRIYERHGVRYADSIALEAINQVRHDYADVIGRSAA